MLYHDDQQLEQSPVVANCCMNRERDLSGTNGYDVEIGFQPLNFLRDKVSTNSMASWLDLCCGTGRALIQAATTSPLLADAHADHIARACAHPLDVLSKVQTLGYQWIMGRVTPLSARLNCIHSA